MRRDIYSNPDSYIQFSSNSHAIKYSIFRFRTINSWLEMDAKLSRESEELLAWKKTLGPRFLIVNIYTIYLL